MDRNRLLSGIEFFEKLTIIIDDNTTDHDSSEGRKRVHAKYQFGQSSFESNDLFYSRVTNDLRIQNAPDLEEHFNSLVYWLDLDNHDWPQGSKESDLEWRVIPDICGENTEFGEFLNTIANNAQTGWIQEMTKDGQRGQYYHNLVNNNHWHDLILLIQALIKSKGETIDEKYFAPLVFEWRNGQRTSLSPALGNRKMIDDLKKNIQEVFKIADSMTATNEMIKLLKHKPQIILQGPPGTGKTRLANEIAQELCRNVSSVDIDNSFINENLYIGLELSTTKDGNKFSIIELGEGIRIKLNNGGDYSVSRERIITCLKNNDLNKPITDEYRQNVGPYILGIARFLNTRLSENNIQLIQFHPSYSYEDFVRGITSKVTDGEVEYIAVDKILGEFAKTATDNYIDSKKDVTSLSREKWAESMLKEYAEYIEEKLQKEPKCKIGDTIIYIFDVQDDAFRYKGDNWGRHQSGLRMKFHQLLDIYLKGVSTRQDIKKIPNLKGLVKEHATYYFKVLQDFKSWLGNKPNYSENKIKVNANNYVLIIDEINRANLSSVLGELIYALEYRGKPVNSIYEVDGDRAITLPPNLFIIGTMNTADRSVGHIDYAVRRRFAFVTVLPDEGIVEKLGSTEALTLFRKIKNMFYNKDKGLLSSEFNPDDVMIGHSYFLETDSEKLKLRYEYEIKPILKEYIKDGILTESALLEL